MAEFSDNLWAPWRMAYINSLAGQATPGATRPACFICHYAADPERDAENLVVWRSERTIVLLNRYPYSSGHLLIAPLAHHAELASFPLDVLTELMARIRDSAAALRVAVDAQGFNVGANLGHCAGAGLPDHLHFHVVPRWGGDTNFMSSLGGVRVMPESLSAVFAKVRDAALRLGLPRE